VNGGHRMGSLPTMASTRTWGTRTSDAGCPWKTDSRTVAWWSLTQPSRAPSRGTGMPSVMTRWLLTAPASRPDLLALPVGRVPRPEGEVLGRVLVRT